MATYAIGDIHGCFETLQRLLRRIAYDPGAGPPVVRGGPGQPRPAFARGAALGGGAGDRIVAVLGNHDLHLLARAAGVAEARKRDTLEDVLAAPDRDDLLAWLRQRPLASTARGRP